MGNVLGQKLFHDGLWLVLSRLVVASAEHCDDFFISFCLGYLSCVSIRHTCDEDLSERVETCVGAQQWLEFFDWAKL